MPLLIQLLESVRIAPVGVGLHFAVSVAEGLGMRIGIVVAGHALFALGVADVFVAGDYFQTIRQSVIFVNKSCLFPRLISRIQRFHVSFLGLRAGEPIEILILNRYGAIQVQHLRILRSLGMVLRYVSVGRDEQLRVHVRVDDWEHVNLII